VCQAELMVLTNVARALKSKLQVLGKGGDSLGLDGIFMKKFFDL
jgi:hypothetical protein